MIYFIGLIIVYFLHVLLKLHWKITLIMGLYMVFVIPLHKKSCLRAKNKQKRFFEVSLYLDTLLYAFVKEEKVDIAVKDVSLTLPDGMLKELTKKAYEHIRMTFDETDVLEDALKIIEQEYPCERLKTVHQFVTHVEYYGGEIANPVHLLLADKGRWERRIKTEIVQRNKQLVDIILSVVVSLFVCGAILNLPINDMDVSNELWVQICSCLVIIFDDFVIYRAQRYLDVDWIGIQLTEEEEFFARKIEDYQNYDEKKEGKKSIILGIIGGMFLVMAVLKGNEWLIFFMMVLTLFLFRQHKVGRYLEKKNLIKEIKYAFPNWLLDLVLLLQSENVQVALQKSEEHVPGVLRKELYILNERLEMEPEAANPYHQFLEGFDIPEVHAAMGILYSLSIGNSDNADKQIGELIERNLTLLDTTETELLRDAASGMYALFLLPVVTASFQLIAVMFFMLLRFVEMPAL